MGASRSLLCLLAAMILAVGGCSRDSDSPPPTKVKVGAGKPVKEETHTEVPAAVRAKLETALQETVFKNYLTVVPDKTEYVKDKGQIEWLVEAEGENLFGDDGRGSFPLSGGFTDRLGMRIKYLDKDKLPLAQQKLVPDTPPTSPSPPEPNPRFGQRYYHLHKGNRTRCTLQLPGNVDWSKVESVIVEK